MKKKYSKKKEAWNNKRSKWKLKLKRMKILISKAREKQSKFLSRKSMDTKFVGFPGKIRIFRKYA